MLVGGAVVGLPTLFDQPPRSVAQNFKVRVAALDGPAAVSVQPIVGAASTGLVRQGSVEMAPPSVAASSGAVAAAMGTAAAVGLLPGTGKKPQVDDNIITETKADVEVDRQRAEKARAERAKADKLKADKAREAEQARAAEKARQERIEKKTREAKAAREAQEAREAAAARKVKEAREAKAAAKAKDTKIAAKPGSDAEKARRYVIQAGSFADVTAARDLGRRIDKLGLDAHEQRVETASGSTRTRVRLGPFNSKEEAMRAAARLKAAGLSAAVLPL